MLQRTLIDFSKAGVDGRIGLLLAIGKTYAASAS